MSVIIRRGGDTRAHSLSMCIPRKGLVRTRGEGGHLQARNRALMGTNPAGTWPWTSSLSHCEKEMPVVLL